MNHLQTFDEFTYSSNLINVFENLSSLDIIEILMETEHDNGLDLIDEGWSFGSKGRGGDKTFKFVPGKNDTGDSSTEIFNTDKKFKYHEVLLPKSGVMSYNLYKISDMRISKALKHPAKFIDIEKRNIDFDSIDKFMKRTSMYIRALLKDNDIDIITYPQSSSTFNKEMVEYILRGYRKTPGIKCIPDLMTKNIRKVYINYEVAKNIGLTDNEIHQLQKDIENWKKDAKLYELRLEIDALNDEILYIKANRKKGRPTKEFKTKEELLNNLKDKIKILRKGRKGKDKTVGADGRAKNFEIKSLEDKRRKSIEGLFEINPNLNGIQQNLKGKNIIIFDDNISSGATLDDICLELQKYGVKSILPITLAIIPKTVYGGNHERLKDFGKEKEETKEVNFVDGPEKIEVLPIKDAIDIIKDDVKENTSPPKEEKEKLNILWLDDDRNPESYLKKESSSNAYLRTKEYYDNNIFNKYDVKFTWVKNYDEFVNYIKSNGLPEFISFDRDLKKGNGIEKGTEYPNGEDCAKWLVKYCKKHNEELPKYFVHSANKNGQKNIPEILENE